MDDDDDIPTYPDDPNCGPANPSSTTPQVDLDEEFERLWPQYEAGIRYLRDR